MARVAFTAHLQRQLANLPARVAGRTVREALDEVFADNPLLRSYVLDDQGRVRKHVSVFVDGAQVRDRDGLSDEVGEESEIYVLQALSGG